MPPDANASDLSRTHQFICCITPNLNRKTRGLLAGLFFDLNKKCLNSEISTRALDLRVREVATVKVLGFNPGETASYILRENLLLSILGGAVGLLLGKLLHRFIMELIQVDYMCYEVRISALSYLLAFGVTVLFALAANFAMSFKLEKINMTESLKSVE